MRRSALISAFCLLPGMGLAQEMTVEFQGRSGAEIGAARLIGSHAGVLILLDVRGLPPSRRMGFHIHETPDCDARTNHEGTGGHFNPSGVTHGYLSETGPHAGDMPNLHSDAEGRVQAEVFNPYVTFQPGAASLRGRSLVIHADADDYASQPSGGAGNRIACAPIR